MITWKSLDMPLKEKEEFRMRVLCVLHNMQELLDGHTDLLRHWIRQAEMPDGEGEVIRVEVMRYYNHQVQVKLKK